MTIATETESLFEIYERRRTELIAVARDQHAILVDLAIDETHADGAKPAALLQELIGRLESERLRVLIVGRFSSGKSTFINALIGQQLLPAAPTPVTGVLCEIRYADEAHKKAILHPKPGLGPNGGSEPFEVSITALNKQLEQYVRIDPKNPEKTSRYRKLEVFWPLAACRHGVDLIDSVGLDDPDSRDVITMEHAGSADAILYCMSSHNAYSAKDAQVIRYLQTLGYRSILFVLTSFDHVREAEAMGEMRVVDFVALQRQNLSPWTELGERGILFVDSKSAMLGRMHGDAAKVVGSGIEEVERNLQWFLTEEKGRAKLLTSLRSLRNANRLVRTTVPARIGLWQTSAAELERKYREAEVPLQALETQRQLMLSKVDLATKDIARAARDLASQHLLSLPDDVKEWAENYDLDTAIPFPPTKGNLQPLVTEVVQHLKQLVEEDIARWSEAELAPMIVARVTSLQAELEEKARAFIEQVDELRIQVLVGVDVEQVQQPEVSMLGRILGGAYTVATGDFLTGGMGVFLGAKAMMTTIALQIGAGILLAIFGLLNPVVIIIAALAAVFSSFKINMSAIRRRIKEKVGATMASEILAQRDAIAATVEQKVAERIGQIRASLDQGLGGEIAGIRGEFEAILNAHRRGQADATAEIRKLKAIEQSNLAVEERIDALMYEAGLGVKGEGDWLRQ